MKNQFVRIILAFLLLMGCLNNINSQTSEKIFQDGLQKEIGEGELLEAIDIYNSILIDENASRNMKAKVLLHIGSCYQKMGYNEASEAYQKIIRDYGDQKEIVDIARSRLNRLSSGMNEPDFPAGISLQQVWTGSDVDLGGSVSPDGKYISFWDHESGNLGYKDLVQDKIRLLTNEGTYEKPAQFTINSTISHEGNKIAYSWYNTNSTYEVRVLDIDNPVPTILYGKSDEEAYPISWSPDDKKLLIRRFSDSYNCQLISLDLSTKDIKILKTFDDGYWMGASYSPDGKYVAYDVPIPEDAGNYDVYILDAAGMREIKLIEHPANDRLLGWMPRTNEIIFISDRTGTWDVWSQEIENFHSNRKAKKLFPGIGQVSSLGFTNFDALYYGVLSRKHISLLAPLGDQNLPVFKLSKPLLGSIYHLQFSPDGKYMSYVKEFIEPAGPGWYYRPLHILDNTTGEDRVVTKGIESRFHRWSNDGSVIFFSGYRRGTTEYPVYNGGIFQLKLHSGEVSEVLRFPLIKQDSIWAWSRFAIELSADETIIYYIDGTGIISRNLETGDQHYLFKDKGLLSILDRSPTTDKLLFAIGSDNGGQSKLYTLNIPESEITEVYRVQNGNIGSAVWSVDGTHIFFSENIDKRMKLWRVPSEGGGAEYLWEAEYKNFSLSIDKSGRRIAISNFMQEAEVWMMQNILSASNKNNN